ncbi:MAG: hypothetical protein Q8N01_01065 [Sulfuricurvum sp.]|jgi:uncharacterized low-complexity protein|nr:hypothetical protein [Sulfuricurvum sp.]MDP3023658.1 hypothetical protein [Sulfuricurvum sp.]MDP3118993.1 hypothetical protein [Sulfuricurvum sp.]
MTKNEVAALVLGATLLSAPMAMAYESGEKCAADKCGAVKTKTADVKCGAGKCGAAKMKTADAKCGSAKDKNATKAAEAKCGAKK